MDYQKPLSEDSFSSRSAHTTTTHFYNGAFTGGKSRELSSSMNEAFYHEIFSLPGCSIPILDIPEPNQMGSDWEILRKADYSNIFSQTAECAIPLEDLLPHKPNAEENLRKKGKSSYKPRNASVTQRKQTLSSDPAKQFSNAEIKLNIPSGELIDQRRFDQNCLHTVVNHDKVFNISNRFSDESLASSLKEVVGFGAASDLCDVIAVGNRNKNFINQIVAEPDSIDPNFRSTESSQKKSESNDSSSVSQQEEKGGLYSKRIGNENSRETHENVFSTSNLEEVKFASKFPNAAMESCELHMKGFKTSSSDFSFDITGSHELRCSAYKASQADSTLENNSRKMISDKEKDDPLSNSTREPSENLVMEHDLSFSKGSADFCDEKMVDSAYEGYHNPEGLEDTSISDFSGKSFPLGCSSRDNFQNHTEMLFKGTERMPSSDLLDAIVEEHHASTQVPSHEKLEEMADANDINGLLDRTFEISQSDESENASEYHSPAFSDEEKDDKSVAAVSAAAVRKAIEEAQATINVAKELLVKTKDGRQNTLNANVAVELLPTIKSKSFSPEESQCKLSNVFSRSLNNSESRAWHIRNEHKTTTVTTQNENENFQPHPVNSSEITALEHELKTKKEETRFNEIQMRHIDDQQNSSNREFLVNFGTFQWNFNASNFKSLQEQVSEGDDEDDFKESRVFALERTIDGDQVLHEHEENDFLMESNAQNESCALNISECLNGNCDFSVPTECFINEPYSESHEFNEEMEQSCSVEQAESPTQNRKVDKAGDKLEDIACEEIHECSNIESSRNEAQDNSNIELGGNGGEDSNNADCIKELYQREEHAAIKRNDEASSSKPVKNNIPTDHGIDRELSGSQEEESSVGHDHDDNQVIMESYESDWYEETIEGITITAELMKANEVIIQSKEGAKLPVACKDYIEEIDRLSGKKIDDTEHVLESDKSDENPDTSNDCHETKNSANIASVESSLHDENQEQSQGAWVSKEEFKYGVECDETCLPQECSDEDRQFSDHEAFFPSETADEYDDTSPWLPEGAEEDDYASVISSDEHVGDDNSASEEGFVAKASENDSDSRSSDEQWGNTETQPEQTSTSRNVQEVPESPFRKVGSSEYQTGDNEKGLKTQIEENDKKKMQELEARRQRIVVERAIKEARERAFAEAAQQFAAKNVNSKSQENEDDKVEKAKQKVDNVAVKAKLVAERAAVEKATTAARVRAFEKLLAEMAIEKASSQKNNEKAKRNTDLPHRKDHKEAAQSSHNPDLNEGTQSNSLSHWEKLAMEKHQQTAERAAKALAEKNKREQLAKEEQDERHRISETLDADVKRWARGKERNLRALLSTLQFILGAESGWQPISRNDLVSVSAVKKAYKKATLFVHPDKMQQRGATISQKYTCEKVFDLLKEARDRFGKEDK